MADQRVIDELAQKIVRETGATLDYAYELAAAALDPNYTDCGPGMSGDDVQDFVRSLVGEHSSSFAAD
jgi:hypothetical protein